MALSSKRKALSSKSRLVYADQYNNDANWQAHYNTTGPELVKQTKASSRTSSADRTAVRAWGLDGISGISTGGRPYCGSTRWSLSRTRRHEAWNQPLSRGDLYPEVPHHQRVCSTEAAYETVLAMARQEGLLIGISAGSLVKTAIDIAQEEAAAGREALIVALLRWWRPLSF